MMMGTLHFTHRGHVVLQPVVAFVDDLVDGKRGGGRFWVGGIVCGQTLRTSISQSSSCAAGRALSAGMEPTTPALHWATTSRVADDEQRRTDRERQVRQCAGSLANVSFQTKSFALLCGSFTKTGAQRPPLRTGGVRPVRCERFRQGQR